MTEPFEIYITKWCLSAGIEKATAYHHPVNAEWVIVADGRFRSMILSGDQWHATEEAAVKWAEKLRKRVIEQDRKRLSELEALTFGGKTEDEE
jgi:hypothetical protein